MLRTTRDAAAAEATAAADDAALRVLCRRAVGEGQLGQLGLERRERTAHPFVHRARRSGLLRNLLIPRHRSDGHQALSWPVAPSEVVVCDGNRAQIQLYAEADGVVAEPFGWT